MDIFWAVFPISTEILWECVNVWEKAREREDDFNCYDAMTATDGADCYVNFCGKLFELEITSEKKDMSIYMIRKLL